MSQTDRPTDKPSYRAAQWQLKRWWETKMISNMDFNMQAKTAIYRSSKCTCMIVETQRSIISKAQPNTTINS